MRIAITGASGNVGTTLVRRLLADGRHEVVGIARRLPPAGAFDGVRWCRVDLTRDEWRPNLLEALTGADAVVHLAWGFQPTYREEYLEELGVGGTDRVLDAVADAGTPHLVHMSSVGAYSPKRGPEPVDESYPTGGIPTSPYSRHKVRAERLLDGFAARHHDVTVTRLRPGIMGRREAGSSLLRYGVPAIVPSAVLRGVPVVPLDRDMVIPMVHTDDVVDAIVRVLERGVPGPFNLAAEPPISADHIAAALHARHVQVSTGVLRTLAGITWRLRLQKVDPGWVDLARWAPTLDCTRAARELDWQPRRDAVTVLAETLAGMREAAHDTTPVLRGRSVPRELVRALREGSAGIRREP